jgi:peptidyl-prolyl cis-trans isomerase SurA
MIRLSAPHTARRLPAAALAAFALLAAACRSTPATPPARAVSADTWASVNGVDITRDQVEKDLRRLRNTTETLSEEEALLAKLSIIEDLIVERILLAKATALNVTVPDMELETAYNNAKQNLPEEEFQKELARRSLTPADMRDGLRREMLARKVLEQEVGSKVSISDQEVTDFFNANRAQFNLPEEALHLAQIVITPGPEQQLANRTGDDAATPQAAAAKVSMIMERLKGGAPFAELARDYSEDPQTAPRGGDLGLVPLSAIQKAPPLLREAAMKTTVGSARVVSEGGAHTIVFVVAREPAGQRDLSSPGVRDRITAALRDSREQLLRAAYLASARTDADVTNYLARRVVESQGKPPR